MLPRSRGVIIVRYIGTAFVGALIQFAFLRPIATVVALIFLGLAYWQLYIKPKSCDVKQTCTLKLHVIAKGIETKEQLQALIEMGCDDGQGYFFSKPLSADLFAQLVKNL